MAQLSPVKVNAIKTGRRPSRRVPLTDRISALWKRIRELPRLTGNCIAVAIAQVPDRASALWKQIRELPPRIVALAIGMGVLAWAYWPNLHDLYRVWYDEPNYSHGFLVMPIALAILWQRLADKPVDWQASPVLWWGWIPLVAVLAVRMIAYERNYHWVESATLVPAVACLVLALGGWSLLQRAWPAVAFLVFMLPLPPSANTMIALPLQRIAAVGSVYVMQLTGLWALAEGNVINLRDHAHALKTLEVAQACNGLSMLMTLAATVTATIILIPLPTWKRIVVLASAIPIALLSNIARIVVTGWCYYYMDDRTARGYAHDMSGIAMMPLALILVGLELLLLSWLAAGSDVPDERNGRVVLPAFVQKPAGKPKPIMPTDEL